MKLYRRRIGLALLFAALLVAAFLTLQQRFSTEIRLAHTSFLFSQLEFAFKKSAATGPERVTSIPEFLDRIPHDSIDWNSCAVRDRTLYDAWNTPTEIRMDASSIHLRSAGPDRSFDTPADIARTIQNHDGV